MCDIDTRSISFIRPPALPLGHFYAEPAEEGCHWVLLIEIRFRIDSNCVMKSSASGDPYRHGHRNEKG
jgi:hypothetical protein